MVVHLVYPVALHYVVQIECPVNLVIERVDAYACSVEITFVRGTVVNLRECPRVDIEPVELGGREPTPSVFIISKVERVFLRAGT